MNVALCWLTMTLLSAGFLEENQEFVKEGQAAYEKKDYDAALKAFDAAKKKLPNSAVVEFNRGTALFKLGRHDEAEQAFLKAQSMDGEALSGRDLYNVATTYASMGQNDNAIRFYRKSLVKNPNDLDARRNLEILLNKKPPPDAGSDGGSDGGSDAGADAGSDAGRDGGTDGGNDAGADAGRDGGFDGGADGGSDGGSDGGGGQGAADGGADGGPDAGALRNSYDAGSLSNPSKRQAEQELDAFRNKEKNLQMWRFQPKPRKRSEKDW